VITTFLAFLLTLGVLIVIHEYGHYRVAVACGVKVLRFSVGFGKVVWRRQKDVNGTEFVLSALPLGGYVRMLDEREGPVTPAERSMAFNNKPLLQRTAIVAAGPVANLLLAILLYAGAHWIGMDEPQAVLSSPPVASIAERAGLRAGDRVKAVSADGLEWTEVRSMSDLRWHVTHAVLNKERLFLMASDVQGHAERQVLLELDNFGGRDVDAQLVHRVGLGQPYGEPVIRDVKAGGAAAKAGVRPGDRVLSVDGLPVPDASRLHQLIRSSVERASAPAMLWRIERGGQILELSVFPDRVVENGNVLGRINAFIGSEPEMVFVQYGLVDGLTKAVSRTWEMSVVTLKMLGQMLTGEASLKNLSGPLTIADYAGQSVRLGIAYYLGFLAVVSVSLGVLNLLPLPMLDGGHLMYYLFEAVTGRPVSELWLDRLQRGGVAIMLMMMSLALYNDVARLLGSH
jgi:regulator of sigma E protease